MRIFCCSNHSAGAVANLIGQSFNPPCGFFVVRTAQAIITLAIYGEFQSAMRIFCCSNTPVSTIPPEQMFVSIRHADFLLFELGAHGVPTPGIDVSIRHADFLLFERLGLRNLADRCSSFNPPCGFFVVRTLSNDRSGWRPCSFQSAMRIFCCSNFCPDDDVRARTEMFQSAMRIFCCSNETRQLEMLLVSDVSIRHADFLLFEQRGDIGFIDGIFPCFNPPCGFFVVRTLTPARLVSRGCCFNPPCGFFVVRTSDMANPTASQRSCFNPPCGFFVVRTIARITSVGDPLRRFQSAMRIFCCSNCGRSGAAPGSVSFNPPCGFFVVRTARRSWYPVSLGAFQSAMRIFCCSNKLPVLI